MMERGVTLLEIIIVVVIVGILALLTLPNFMPGRESALEREAISNLKLIAAAQRLYKAQYGTYYPQGTAFETNPSNLSSFLKISLNERYWDYDVQTTPTTYTIRARRTGARGCRYSFTNNDPDDEPDASNAVDCYYEKRFR